jgi:hypothetical protein
MDGRLHGSAWTAVAVAGHSLAPEIIEMDMLAGPPLPDSSTIILNG